MQATATPLRKREGSDTTLATPIKHANLSSTVRRDDDTIAKSFVGNSLRGRSLVAIDAVSSAQIVEILKTAGHMHKLVETRGYDDSLKGKVLATVFYEPSTRTNCSFQAAMLRLGGNVITVNESSSSVAKGETLSDTVRCLESYCDVVALRHPRAGAAAEAAAAMSKPLLNAGDGVGEHPTQALLDLYTILDEILAEDGAATELAASEASVAATLRNKVITMVGDLKNGRTVHSLAKLLNRFQVTLRFVSPATLRMPEGIVAAVHGGPNRLGSEHDVLTTSILEETDILYVTRVQKERFQSVEDYDRVKDAFVITPDVLSRMKPTARVLHPLPRVGEIDPACDADPRAAYFRQMKNGMFVRMALLRLILG